MTPKSDSAAAAGTTKAPPNREHQQGTWTEPPGAGQLLTQRERHILELLAEDLPLKTISHNHGIGYGTLKTHQRSIFRKLDVHTRAAAISRGISHGLIETS
jgi:DNA-binding CsgD family transcriptional regulator